MLLGNLTSGFSLGLASGHVGDRPESTRIVPVIDPGLVHSPNPVHSHGSLTKVVILHEDPSKALVKHLDF